MFNKNYIIKGELICETGLHIGGSNDNIEIGGADSIVIRDSIDDLPFIPGSSLKGKLRSLLELYDKKSSENVVNNEGRVTTDENTVAAQIFGVSAEKGRDLKYPTRIIVRDCFPTEETKELWKNHEDIIRGAELKYENTINRMDSSANPRNIERVPKGSSFDFEIIFSVYDEDNKDNINSLLHSMRLLEDNYLGGSGSRGFGKVKFDKINVFERDLSYYKEDIESEALIENANLKDVINFFNE